MKWILALAGFGLAGLGFITPSNHLSPNEMSIIISGGAKGHLSPCGCTKPMSGGFKRLATVVREMKAKGNVVWIDTGDIIGTPGRQSQLKAETYGELMGALGVDAVAYTGQDQKQGVGLLVAAASLSGKKWLTPDSDATSPTIPSAMVGGLTVIAANETTAIGGDDRDSDILLLDGPERVLAQLTKSHQIKIFASDGIPTINGSKMSPGSNLRGVVVATFRDGKFVSARVELLEPGIKDDPKASQIYDNYLSRVTQERLIDNVAKENMDDYAGSRNCQNCHRKIYDQFMKTKHAGAYGSLVKERHHADPDCLPCHVVGLNSSKGYVYQKTPSLAQVGCESCHEAGREHARNPRLFHLPKVTEQKCLTCHTPSNSAGFIFKTYWQKIKHRK